MPREIIATYADRVIPILQENRGQASALNAGFAHSRGDIILFLDSDDALLPDLVQQVAHTFQQNPTVAKVQFRMEIIDAAGARTGDIRPLAYLPRRSGDLRQYVLTFPFDVSWMSTSGNAFAARVLREIFPIPPEEFRILADYYLSNLTPLFGDVVFLDEVGAYYRIHGANHYALASPSINLDHLHQSITYSQRTYCYLRKFAEQLNLAAHADDGDEVLSVSLISERMLSLKLDRGSHPLPKDTLGYLFRLGVRAALRRFDVLLPMRLLFVLWFAALALAPERMARWLGERFFFPETRAPLNQLLKRLHR